jgi:hypothetical protein
MARCSFHLLKDSATIMSFFTGWMIRFGQTYYYLLVVLNWMMSNGIQQLRITAGQKTIFPLSFAQICLNIVRKSVYDAVMYIGILG